MKTICSVSVIIPIWGHLDVLPRAISSISHQTYLPCEVIVINDGGGEDVLKRLHIIKSHFLNLNIRIINSTQNNGAGVARNIGWDKAVGEYVAFLDADDEWHPQKIELQYLFMKNNNSITLCGHLHTQVCKQKNSELLQQVGEALEISLFRLLFSNPFITPSVMLRRQAPFRFHPLQRHSEDYSLWLEIASRGYKICIIKSYLAYIYKPLISSSGLSSNLLEMEVGEIKAYFNFCRSSIKYNWIFPFLFLFSLVKFSRRILIRVLLSFLPKNYND